MVEQGDGQEGPAGGYPNRLAGDGPPSDPGRTARLLRLPGQAQAALAGAADLDAFAQALCAALCDPLSGWPGLLHAAVFHRQPGGDLRMAGQGGKPGLLPDDLPGRHALPALRAAADGVSILAETPQQTGDPALADALAAHGVATALGVPILSDGPAPARGALSLLFGEARSFTADELALLDDIARLAGLAMRLFDTAAENDALLAQLAHATTMDALTGVANRRHGETLLEVEIRRARRYGLPLALVAIDIDRFRAINDTYGYPVGDMALRLFADTTRALLRTSDVLVRSGGEEFHVIAPHTSATDGLRMAEKIRQAIEATPFPGCDHLTVSLGVAQLGEGESAGSLTRRADAALARAKRAGRNCVELAMQ